MRGPLVGSIVLLAALAPGCAWRRGDQATKADLAALEKTRDELRARLDQALIADPRIASAPQADIVIGIPVAFASGLVKNVTAGFLNRVEIVLRDIKIHAADDVHARTKLFGTIKPGHFTLDMNLQEARAVLSPGTPKVEFKGERLKLELPVTVARGSGQAELTFAWDSKGLGSIVCEDFTVVEPVSGRVQPVTYTVKGAFRLAVDEGALVASPEFPDLVVHIVVEPSEETWLRVDEAIDARRWTCVKVLEKVKVPKLLQELLDRGFDVRVPRSIFKPIRLPAAFQESVTFEGRSYGLGVKPLALRVTPDILWYGADVQAARPTEPRRTEPQSTLRPQR
jgi:hypothetical protein